MSDTVKFEESFCVSPRTSDPNSVVGSPEIPGLQILSKYGETSTADVWSALQISLERLVTVWIMKEVLSRDKAQAQHFENVARAVSRIRHPNLLQVINVARTALGVPYVVYENVDGTSLASILHLERKIDPVRALRIISEIAKVLDSAWKQCGFVHRNIKPETVLIGAGDVVKLTNFSSATLVKPGENPLAYDDGMVVGTPSYASPEQIECLRSIDYHSDMYSAGALFYQMVTGITPFGDESDPMRILELQRVGTVANPRDLDPSVKPGVVHIIQKMMAKAPEERYKWWQDALEDLQRVLDGRPPYLESSNYVPPLSTVAPSTAEIEAGTPSLRSKGRLIDVPMRKLKTYSAQDPERATSPKPSAGPGFFLKAVAFVAITVFSVWLTGERIRDLEGKGAQNEVVVGADPAVVTNAVESTNAVVEVLSSVAAAIPSNDLNDEESTGEGSSMDTAMSDSGESPTVEQSSESSEPQVVLGQSEDSATGEVARTEEAEAVPTLSVQQKLVRDIYKAVVEKSFDEAKVYARSRFLESKEVAGVDMEESKLIWSAFVEASSFEDLLGISMTRSPGARNLSVGGTKIVFVPRMYSNGELIGTLQNADGTTLQGYRVNLTEMSPEEMYDAVLSSVVDPSRPALLSRAFLTMKMGGRGAFSILVEKYDIPEMKPFLDYVGK